MLRTFSKIFGLAGLRLGYLIADPGLVHFLHSVQEPFNVNRAALAAGVASLGAPDEVAERRALAAAARERLREALLAGGMRPGRLVGELRARRPRRGRRERWPTGSSRAACSSAPGSELGLPGWARITVAPEPVMDRAAAALLQARAELIDAQAPAA